MSHRRKRSKGSWSNPVKGAMVINKGGGGGEKKRSRSLEDAQQRSVDMRGARHLADRNMAEERRRADRMSRLKDQIISGGKRMSLESNQPITNESTERYTTIRDIMRVERLENAQ